MLDDILAFSADRLVDGGRLCMWMPVAGSGVPVGCEAAAAAAPPPPPSDAPETPDTHIDKVEAEAEAEVEAEAETEAEYPIPRHPALALISICQQDFNKWSRRLLTYRRLPDNQVDETAISAYTAQRLLAEETSQLSGSDGTGKFKADDLNDFRKRYFQGFRGEPGAGT